MADIKLMVMYPCPHDIRAFEKLYEDEDMPMRDGLSSEYAMSFETFEKLYHEEHVPMIVEKLVGKTRFVATKVVATPDGTPPPFYRIAEIHFPSLEALQACAQSEGGKETVAHAVEISSGGAPTFLLAEEQTLGFDSGPVWDRLRALISRQ
ncbi:MAG: EthD family reductase [Gammaproteobacteria bacterium]